MNRTPAAMRPARFLATAFALLSLAGLPGCSRQAAFDAIVDHQVEAEARADIDRLANHDPGLDSRLAPELRTDEVRAKIADLAREVQGVATERHLVGYSERSVNGDARYELTYELRHQDPAWPWQLQRIRLHRTTEGLLVEAMNVTPLKRSVEEINAFTLEGRPAWMLAMLPGMVLVPAFIVFTLVACARTRGVPRKWAWMLFIAFGIGGVTVDWANGAVALQFAVYLLGASFVSPGVAGPWFLTLAFPLGAVMFWVRRRGWRNDPGPTGPVEAAAVTGPAST